MKNKFLISFFIMTFCVLFQSLYPGFLKPWNIFPDLCLVFIIILSYSLGWEAIMPVAFLSGLMQDFLSSGPLGFYAFLNIVLALIFGLLKGKVSTTSFVFPFTMGFIASIIRSVLIYLLIFWFRFEISNYAFSFLAWQYWVSTFMDSLLVPLFFFLFSRNRFFKKILLQDRM